MAIDLVTGHAGTDHVSSASAGRYNAGVCGPEKYVLETGRKFAATIESANMIRIASGDAVNQGRHITIPQNTYEDAEIITGAQGKTRIDVITLRYTKTTQEVGGEVISVEAASIAVIKGAEVSSGSTPEVPAINEGDIFNGDVIDDMALYHVLITDMTITSVTPVFVTMKSIELIDQKIGSTAMGTTAPTVTGAIAEIVNKIGSTSMGTSVWTVTGAIGEIADKLGSIAMGTSATTVTGAIKELVNKVGSTAMGTSATTVTAAIKELVNKIGATAMGTTATTITGAIKELKTALSALQGLIGTSTFRIYEKTWDNISIGADWYYDRSAFNVTMSGYRALAITGFGVYPASSGGVYANWCLFQKCVLWRNTTSDFLDYYVWNQNKSAAAKVKIRVWILYVKTGLI